MTQRIALAAVLGAGLLTVVVPAGFVSPARAREDPPAGPLAAKGHEFGDVVLYVVTKPRDSKSEVGTTVLEKARVARLGDVSFLVGATADIGGNEIWKLAAGKKVWIPVSDVSQLVEFKTIAELKQYFDEARKNVDKGGQEL
jgi:hypothetical protein